MLIKSGKPTIKQVAELANVSPTAVSLILNHPGKHRYSKETQQVVIETCRKLGYKPNALAKSLVTRSNTGIGLLCDSLDDPTVSRAVNQAVKLAAENGYHVVISTEPWQIPWEHLLEEGRVGYVISIGGNFLNPPQRPDQLGRNGTVPMGYGNIYIPPRPVPQHLLDHIIIINEAALPPKVKAATTITWDGKRHGQLAIDHLHKLGHSEIAVLAGFWTDPATAAPRLQGACERATELGVTIRWLTDFNEKPQEPYTAVQVMLKEMFEKYPNVTAILCRKDDQAVGVYHELHRRSIQIPRDISVIGNFNLQSRFLLDPPLTSVASPLGEALEKAVQLTIHNNTLQWGSHLDLSDHITLIVRESTALSITAKHRKHR